MSISYYPVAVDWDQLKQDYASPCIISEEGPLSKVVWSGSEAEEGYVPVYKKISDHYASALGYIDEYFLKGSDIVGDTIDDGDFDFALRELFWGTFGHKQILDFEPLKGVDLIVTVMDPERVSRLNTKFQSLHNDQLLEIMLLGGKDQEDIKFRWQILTEWKAAIKETADLGYGLVVVWT